MIAPATAWRFAFGHISINEPGAGGTTVHRAIWRRHCYAGLILVPFVIVLVIAGLYLL